MSIRRELGPTLTIAIPVILAELGWIATGVVDTVMVGPLGPEAISAAGVGTSMHMGFVVLGMGVLLGLDTLVSQAFGRKDLADCHRWLFDGLTLAAIMTIPLTAVCALVWLAIPHLGFHPSVQPLLRTYFGITLLSTPFLLLYAACRRYLQGRHIVTPVMFALISANIINAGLNWVFIHGHFGLPALGVAGSAWSTFFARLYMLAVLAFAVWWYNDGGLGDAPRGIDRERLKRLLALGVPAASQLGAEVGVFALATTMSGMLDPISSAAHQIALEMAGLAFMIPLGLGSAGAVRVGHAVGAGERARAAAAGWTTIALGTGFMMLSGLTFLLIPNVIIGMFTKNQDVLRVGTSLLALASVFQLFDGIQGVTTGTLRGLGNTHVPMKVNLIAHWLLGLPTSYVLCFILGWGVYGLWVGLSMGLIVTGIILLRVWQQEIRAYVTSPQPAR